MSAKDFQLSSWGSEPAQDFALAGALHFSGKIRQGEI
jgi:hypothetical protein